MDPVPSCSNMENKALSQRNSSNNKSHPIEYPKEFVTHKKQTNGNKRQQQNAAESNSVRRETKTSGGGKEGGRGARNRNKAGGQVENYDASYEDEYDLLPLTGANGRGGGRKSSGRHDWAVTSFQHEREASYPQRGAKNRGGEHKRHRGEAKTHHHYKRSSVRTLWLAQCQFLVNSVMEASLRDTSRLPVGVAASAKCFPEDEDHVYWTAVEQVKMHETQHNRRCPICLCTPVAPQVTKCGHVYCYPCILHYLALSDDKARICPICFESVEQNHLRSVVVKVHPFHAVGCTITMVLMKRKRGSNIPVPISCEDDTSYDHMARKVSADLQKTSDIVDRELTALQVLLCEDESAPEAIFIEQAMELIRAKAKLWLERYSSLPPDRNRLESVCSDSSESGSVASLTEQLIALSPLSLPSPEASTPLKGVEVGDDGKEVLEFSLSEEQSVENPKRTGKNTAPKEVYHFYQAQDGSHVYLNAMNLSMLLTEYGSPNKCPPTISARILEKTDLVMNASLRERSRNLQHLPLYCPYETAELELCPPLVSVETLANYQELLSKRKHTRKLKALEELRIERRNRALQEEEVQGRLYRRIDSEAPSINASEMDLPPSYSLETLNQHFPHMEGLSGVKANRPASEDTVGGPTSFANMVRTRKKNSGDNLWPSLGSSPAVGFSTPSPPTVWGSRAPGECGDIVSSSTPSDDCDAHVAPDYRQTFSKGLDALFDSHVPSGSSKKKNKKGKRNK